MAVEDGRHLTRAAGATSGALAEFRAGLGSDTYLGHDKTPRVQPRSTGNTAPVVRTIPALGGEHGGVTHLVGTRPPRFQACPASRHRTRPARERSSRTPARVGSRWETHAGSVRIHPGTGTLGQVYCFW
ncbi:hypothetical protein BQ8420_02705 [Nocardiopsis sp. JB363]|nr:hypothetical protein BQ8420_02705 [Nocardiopsis sp. JB363]